MENMEKALYRVTTRGCGTFYVVASSFECAADEVTRELNAQDYGHSDERVVISINFICRQRFRPNGKRALYGDYDENHLMISMEVEDEIVGNKRLVWLEKQGESVEINPTEFDTRLQGTYQTPDEIIEECHQDNADRIIDIVTEHGNPSEWNEEDENEYNHILKILNLVAEEQETKGYNNLISSVNWFKSLKDRIQPKQNNNPQGKTALEAIKEEKVDNSNKVEPKFKVGDWVVRKDGGVFDTETKFAQITEIDGEKHWFDTGLICLKAEDMRLWTLEDAKDGDIIYTESKFNTFDFIYIFYTLGNGNLWCYCNVSSDSDIYSDDLEYWEFDSDKGFVALDRYNFYPASKEQRHLLYQKMKNAGYEWDSEKKELIKL